MTKTKARKKRPSSQPARPVPEPCSFPTVGIGASAGGLEVFTQLLQELPPDTGMAFVLIQHLDPTHSSILSEALGKHTQMQVQEITDGMRILPNQVFVIPPGNDIGILGGLFALFARDQTSRRPQMPIDFFFRALAAECGSRAIGVVLTGTASDGTEGLRAIKAENGVTLVQDPKTAKFDGMPQSAVNAEVADFTLPVTELAQELVHLSRHPYIAGRKTEVLSQPSDDHEMQKVFVLLRTAVGIDFSEYKPPTIKRRLARRMALLKIDRLSEYIKHLQNSPEEIKSLASDFLIHVTTFFRDPDAFEKLKKKVFPQILKKKPAEAPIRIWVTGCSSGEEVYSIAIALIEFLGDHEIKHPIQMFGSDLSERMIEIARAGIYSDSALRDVSPERLSRFFIKTEGGHRISGRIRDLCIFLRHDLARDPAFSKLDLVTCRNVLIYFEPVLQRRILSTFHYCLNEGGFLLLGHTESILSQDQFFVPVDKTSKLFKRAAVTSQLRFPTMQNTPMKSQPFRSGTRMWSPPIDIVKQVDSLLLSEFAPAGVLVNERTEVLQYRGKTGAYLEAPPGHPQLNLLKMVREGLFSPLKSALTQAKERDARVRKDGVTFKYDGRLRSCNLIITPVEGMSGAKDRLFLVLFEDETAHSKSKKGLQKPKRTKEKAVDRKDLRRSAGLERELKATQEYLQSINEEHQKTNESLNSLNEEFVSGNEELQSMNEELETAKEELQSTNEELTTVNDELQNRSQETALINDDLINVLNGVELPILILDINRKIRRFTPKARKIMNLLPTDIGRQIADIKPNILVDDLELQVQEVIDTVTTKESEVQDREGCWHRLQIRPYKTLDHKIAGAVISLVNIDLLRRAVIDAEWVRDYSSSIVEAVQIPLLAIDSDLKILSANHAYYECFHTGRSETEGRSLFDLPIGLCAAELLKRPLEEMSKKHTSFQGMEIECEVSGAGPRVMSLSARPIQAREGGAMILLAIEDITERKHRERDRRELLLQAQDAKAEADKANLTKDLFLATLSHELRTPLTSLILQAQMLQRGDLSEAKVKKASIAIERAGRTQSQLIEDLLDVSRIVTGKLKMEHKPVDLCAVIHAAIETVQALAENKSVTIVAELDRKTCLILGDAVRLQQVIWNLLTNAIKFTAKTGSDIPITVKLGAVNGRAEIKVIDQGIGIEPAFLPNVFKRFSQADDTSTRGHGGLGLGLAIVRHLVELHGGTVAVASEGIGRGATFTIELPLGDEESAGDSEKSTKSSHPQNRVLRTGKVRGISGRRILLVEDDSATREAISEMLGLAGAEVRSAASAGEAMLALQGFTPDEMVLDIAMPGENGYSLLKRIRKLDQSGRRTPALALTALASEKDRADAFDAGFEMHLTKPVDMERLTAALVELDTFH